jgi:repressor LexA
MTKQQKNFSVINNRPLTDEQDRVLSYIVDQQQECGAPPTVREICHELGYKSVNNARQHLRLIEQKGYIRLTKNRARGIELLVDFGREHGENEIEVPLVGTVAAGMPITAIENLDGHITLDRNLFRGEGLFTLRIKGDSMKEIGVLDGDIVIVQQQNTALDGEVVVAIIDGEATLKRYIKEKNRIILRAENPAYRDIIVESDRDIWLAGKMVGVMRKC